MLETVPGGVESMKEQVVKFMADIKHQFYTLYGNRNVIERDVEEASATLNNTVLQVLQAAHDVEDTTGIAVKKVQVSLIDTVDQAFGDTTKYADALQQHILEATEKALKYVIFDIRSLFAEGHKADLAALKTLVDGQKEEIEKIINHDKANNIKGLLQKIYGGVYPNPPSPPKPDVNNLLHKLKSALPTSPPGKATPVDLKKFPEVAMAFNTYADDILMYIQGQVMTPGSPKQPTDQSTKVGDLKNALDFLLRFIANNDTIYHFDDYFVKLLDNLNSQLTSLSPSFSSPSPLLALLKAGLSAFTQQLGHAYVNRYSGRRMGELVEKKQSSTDQKATKKQLPDTSTDNYDLTPEGRNCAKVCLTIVEMLTKNFVELKDECQVYKSKQINTYDDNLFGECFTKRGFTVTSDKGRQHGELQDKSDMTGDAVYKKITAKVTGVQMLTFLKTWKEEQRRKHPHRHPNGNIHLFDVLDFLQGYVVTYYTVRHLEHIPSAKAPRNIYQMLQWLSGVRYYPSLIPLFLCFKDLFPRRKEDEGKDIKAISPASVKLSATTEITYAHLGRKVFVNVCLHAHDVLVAILGHGHAGGRYAVDFKTNEAKLLYPSKASDCFDMLVDIAYRVQHQLYFLFQQFYFESSYSSWRDCLYGRGVAGSSWKCNTKQCPNHDCNQTARQTANQMGNQTCDQHCDQYPMCDLKSPLQSFLEDGLQGFLPHQFTKPGCKLECTAANHKAIPCKTPMGFGDISNMASHTQKGTHLRDVLIDFCGNSTAPLTLMCAYFNCLLQRPPQNLGDMFAFYYNLMKEWSKNETHKRKAFDEAVRKANFENRGTTLELDDVFSAHSNISSNHAGRHLSSLVNCDGDSGSNCGRYLKPISTDVYTIYSSEYADKYVSWIVYLTETFYDLLKKLYDECNGNCGPKGSNCHNKCCVKGCPSLVKESKNVTHDEGCTSIVQCKHTLPTLCRYGFTFWYQTRINGEQGIEKKRTCKDLCNVLERVLSDKEADQAPLAKLIYVTIPNFLFEIRAPFIWLNVALWLLSLLYLLHIMVIRLDLLHIKSHLHSPSSHRIAAQSLLSAARVNKLNRVFYLQP
ncbi:hypothetical protein, conserved [Babesia bigemina]|uniref:C3H1-type domain-containing protein n=1 Tax=Babesia bigemina TaxID=5866 RepID=A0A061BL20_BABBI|nr:hypothetical protein, conserved [Babesia bigemina]CDR71595.1 hypothetical protein, conserved [Babesia bigemina]|eukprot:XP_012770542.1 hypothetical protein, conserved [Babesia bigemina]